MGFTPITEIDLTHIHYPIIHNGKLKQHVLPISEDEKSQYAELHEAIDAYPAVLEYLSDYLSQHATEVFDNEYHKDTLQALYAFQQELLEVEESLESIVDMLEESSLQYPPLLKLTERVQRNIDKMKERLALSLNVNLAVVGMAQNDVVKKLAAWAAIAAVPTMIASIYGMNFTNMVELSWRYGYPASLALMALSSYMMYARLKKSNWL